MPLTMLQQEQDVPEAESPDAPLNKKLRLTQVHDKMFRRTSGISQTWAVIVDEERNLAVNKWFSVVVLEPLCFTVARAFFQSKTLGFKTGPLSQCIADALSIKATSTLHTRANHFLRFLSWTKTKGVVALPLSEACVYFYFQEQPGV